MAAAITAPLPSTPGTGGTLKMGKPFTVTGTGWAATHAATVVINQLGVTLNVTTDGSGNLTTASVATLVPQSDTPIDITVSDGTSTLSVHCEVDTE